MHRLLDADLLGTNLPGEGFCIVYRDRVLLGHQKTRMLVGVVTP
jgi:hypothetical protein